MRFFYSYNAGTVNATDLPLIDKKSSIKDSDEEW